MVRTRPQSPLTRMVLFTQTLSRITTTDSDGKPTTILTTYPSPSDDGKDKTTVTTDKDGVVHTDIISHITTTDSDGKPTTILTTTHLQATMVRTRPQSPLTRMVLFTQTLSRTSPPLTLTVSQRLS
ncbi:Hypothetical protein J6888_03073 [Nakaseomyces glabratus]